jgi:hypothetical protein
MSSSSFWGGWPAPDPVERSSIEEHCSIMPEHRPVVKRRSRLE